MTRRTRWIAPIALGLGMFLVATHPAHRAGAAAGAAPKPGAGSSRPASKSGNQPMPDTVLALVANGRSVTLSGFQSAWRQVKPPDRPDSLTPPNARKFLDLLIEKEALAEAALREAWVWTDRESAEYNATRDGMTMKVVLDSVLAGMRGRLAAGGAGRGKAWADSLSPQDLGIAARESTAVALGARFDRPMLERMTRAFAAVPKPAPESSLFAQLRMINVLPQVDTTDFVRAVATTNAGSYTVGEMLAAWKLLSPVYRPRIEVPEQLQDVVENQLFERELRAEVERRRIAEQPHIVAELARKREFFAVTHLVGRDVYDKIATDSTTLFRYYAANRSYWDLPFRVQIARFVMGSREAGMAVALQLSDPVKADSLLAKGSRAGAGYRMEVSAESDSVLFAKAMRAGPGNVIGPDSVKVGWEVVRVLAVQPSRPRTFQECRTLVQHRWYGEEGERLMVELLARSRRQTRVVVNEKAVSRLTSS